MFVSLGDLFLKLVSDGKAVEQGLCTGKAEQSQYFWDREVFRARPLCSRAQQR
jgi:hypothetical protein